LAVTTVTPSTQANPADGDIMAGTGRRTMNCRGLTRRHLWPWLHGREEPG